MHFAFDHLVHFVNSPQEAVEQMRRIGLYALLGGEHEKWGSCNALSYFDLSYIEFLGLNKPALAKTVTDNDLVRQAVHALPENQGFARIAIRTDNIEEAAAAMRQQGLEVTGPFAGSRKRDDGTTLIWSMFFMRDPHADELPLPFVIQWGEGDEVRREDLRSRRVIAPHPAGAAAFRTLAFAVQELEVTAAKWSRLFNLPASEPFVDEHLQARCIEVTLSGGNLLFCSPHGAGTVSKRLAEKGAGPFLLRLSGTDRAGTSELLLGGTFEFTK